MRTCIRLLSACIVITAGCAADSAGLPRRSADIITAAEAYTPHAGDVWTFVNGYGDTTTVTSESAGDSAACRGGNNIVWHYRKSAARAYWNPGVDAAELRFVLHQNADSSWRSTASAIAFPHSCPWCSGGWTSATWDILDNAPGVPMPYLIVPPTLHAGDHLVNETRADAVGGTGILTLGCLAAAGQLVAAPGHGEQWRTEFYLEDVATPVYTGPAAVSEQWENCNDTRTNAGCGHEKWWFAPALGLVKVWQINSGSGVEGDLDQRLIMVRVR